MSQELNETIFKKLKESIMTMTYQIENINKMDLKKKTQQEILKLKNTITKLNTSLIRLICVDKKKDQ